MNGEGMNSWLQTGISGFFAQNPELYQTLWRLGLLGFVLLLGTLAILAFAKQEEAKGGQGIACATVPNWVLHPGLFLFITLAGTIVLWLPAFGMWEANVDEGLWIAGALTLGEDPRFWYSVDGTTGGPLVIYPLMLFPAFGLGHGYGVIRILTLAVTLTSMVCVYGVFRNLFNEAWARVLALPYIVMLASMNYRDFVSYNAEVIPILFLSLSLLLVTLALKEKPWQPVLCLLVAGVCLGCLPYAKLQSVPIGLALAVITGLWLLWQKRWGALAAFVVGGLVPSIFVFSYLWVSGLWEVFWISYIESNLNFASKGFWGRDLSWGFLAYRLAKKSILGLFMLPWTITYGLSLAVLVILAFRARQAWWQHYGGWVLLAALLLAMGLYVNLKPSTHHWHHFLFLFLPLGFTAGMLLGVVLIRDHAQTGFSFTRGRGLLAMLYLVVLTVLPGCYFAWQGNTAFPRAAADYQRGTNYGLKASKILEYAKPGDRLTVWGFDHHLYVETGLSQGTREAMPQFQIQIEKFELPHEEYYFQRYVQDLRERRPRVLIDTVGEKNEFFKEERYRHTSYPLIRDYVAANYELVHDEPDFRLYVLKEEGVVPAPSQLLDTPEAN